MAHQVTHVSISESSDSACHRQVKFPADAMHEVSCGDGHVLHGASGGSLMSGLLLLDRWWCDGDGRQAVWNVCLLLSSPKVPGYRGINSRIRDNDMYGFKYDLCTLVETQDLLSDYVDVRLRRVLTKGGILKLGFGDENPESNLVLNSPSSAHVW